MSLIDPILIDKNINLSKVNENSNKRIDDNVMIKKYVAIESSSMPILVLEIIVQEVTYDSFDVKRYVDRNSSERNKLHKFLRYSLSCTIPCSHSEEYITHPFYLICKDDVKIMFEINNIVPKNTLTISLFKFLMMNDRELIETIGPGEPYQYRQNIIKMLEDM